LLFGDEAWVIGSLSMALTSKDAFWYAMNAPENWLLRFYNQSDSDIGEVARIVVSGIGETLDTFRP
jgi:hypothetical protein